MRHYRDKKTIIAASCGITCDLCHRYCADEDVFRYDDMGMLHKIREFELRWVTSSDMEYSPDICSQCAEKILKELQKKGLKAKGQFIGISVIT